VSPRRNLVVIVLAVLPAAAGCESCRSPSPAGGAAGDPPASDAARDPDVPAPDAGGVPPLPPGELGLPGADPAQSAARIEPALAIRSHLIATDYEGATSAVTDALEAHPGNLEALLVRASLAALDEEPAAAVDVAARILAASYVAYEPRVMSDPAIAGIEAEDPEAWEELLRARRAARGGWVSAVTSPGAFVLVAPRLAPGAAGDPHDEKLHRGWVVFVDVRTGRFLPMSDRRTVAGFLLDRRLARLYLVSWKSYRRASVAAGETVRPALLQGVEVTYVDLRSMQAGPEVPLGEDVIGVRLSARSGLLLAAVERHAAAGASPETRHLRVDWTAGRGVDAAAAAPGPMDVEVRFDGVDAPEPMDPVADAEAIPSSWRCVAVDGGANLCAVPAARGSVLSDVVLRVPDGPGETLAEDVGVLQVGVL
jgi:hypothetical protein